MKNFKWWFCVASGKYQGQRIGTFTGTAVRPTTKSGRVPFGLGWETSWRGRDYPIARLHRQNLSDRCPVYGQRLQQNRVCVSASWLAQDSESRRGDGSS